MTRNSLPSHPWRLLTLLVVAIFSLSLVSPASTTTQVPPSSALATQFFNAVGGESPAYMLSTGAVLHTPEGTFNGVTGPAQLGDELEASFSNVQFAVNSAAQASNGFVIASFTLTGINTGAYHGLTANCSGISVPGVALFKLTEESVVSTDWNAHPRDQRNSIPVYETVTLVSEQWVNYDTGLIESQIGSFTDVNPGHLAGCSDFNSANDADPEHAPSCIAANRCAMP